MKRRAMGLLGCLLAVPFCEPVYADQNWVQVRQVVIRSEPEHFGKRIATAKYGDALEVSSESNGWMTVAVPGQKRQGYVPVSALTKKQVILSARAAVAVKADPSEVVLAGKGFSKEIEEEYRRTDSNAGFDRVDAIERMSMVSEQEVQVFAKQGGLIQ